MDRKRGWQRRAHTCSHLALLWGPCGLRYESCCVMESSRCVLSRICGAFFAGSLRYSWRSSLAARDVTSGRLRWARVQKSIIIVCRCLAQLGSPTFSDGALESPELDLRMQAASLTQCGRLRKRSASTERRSSDLASCRRFVSGAAGALSSEGTMLRAAICGVRFRSDCV